jgi:hypothetical protein
LQIDGVGVDGVGGPADDVGQEQLAGGDVTGVGALQQALDEELDIGFGDGGAQGAAECGGLAGEGVAGAAGVAVGEAAAGVATEITVVWGLAKKKNLSSRTLPFG